MQIPLINRQKITLDNTECYFYSLLLFRLKVLRQCRRNIGKRGYRQTADLGQYRRLWRHLIPWLQCSYPYYKERVQCFFNAWRDFVIWWDTSSGIWNQLPQRSGGDEGADCQAQDFPETVLFIVLRLFQRSGFSNLTAWARFEFMPVCPSDSVCVFARVLVVRKCLSNLLPDSLTVLLLLLSGTLNHCTLLHCSCWICLHLPAASIKVIVSPAAVLYLVIIVCARDCFSDKQQNEFY